MQNKHRDIRAINFENESALIKEISSLKVELQENSIKFGVDSLTKLQKIVHSKLICKFWIFFFDLRAIKYPNFNWNGPLNVE